MIFAPSVLAFLVIFLVCIYPLMNSETMSTTATIQKIDFGFQMIDNSTNLAYSPYNSWYAYIYSKIIKDYGVQDRQIHSQEFFDNIHVTIKN